MTSREDLAARVEALFGPSTGDLQQLDAHYVPQIGEQNTFEAAILRAQEAYPELILQGLMAGVLPTTQLDCTGDLYCQQLSPASENGRLWLWMHDEPFSWGQGAPSFPLLREMLQLLKRYEEADLEDLCIEDEVNLSELHAKKRAEERLALIEDEALRARLSPIIEAWAKLGVGYEAPQSDDFSGLQELLDYLVPAEGGFRVAEGGPGRFAWIAATLVGNPHYVSHAPLDNAATVAFDQALAREDLAEHLPDALFWLLWSYFIGEREESTALCDQFEKSPARLLRDAAALVKELNAGREVIGRADLQAAREAFRSEREKHRTT